MPYHLDQSRKKLVGGGYRSSHLLYVSRRSHLTTKSLPSSILSKSREETLKSLVVVASFYRTSRRLADYYEMGGEVTTYKDVDDLTDKTSYYLQHEDERAAIAEAGFQRTLREHTYVHRFNEIFQSIGVS